MLSVPAEPGSGVPGASSHPAEALARPRLLVPGRNCWRIDRASRLAFLIDGDGFRMRLVPGEPGDGLPGPLGEFLNAIVAARRRLRGYVLS